jgi:hypothetical protein
VSDRQRARVRRASLERSWSAFMSGKGEYIVRDEVLSSWRRTSRSLAPVLAGAPSVPSTVDPTPLLKSVHILDREFRTTLSGSGLVVALADEVGRMVWTTGEPSLLRIAEQANFAPGALWDEPSMGINAISLAMTSDAPATVWSAEHWSSVLHYWSCYASPIRHPETGRRLGVLNFSTRWDKGHPLASTAVVALAERLAPEIASHAAARDKAVGDAITLTVLGPHRATLAGRELNLTRRQTEIVLLLALRPEGIGLDELHADLYGDAGVGIGTLKAEVSHLRRSLAGRISRTPYRLAGAVRIDALEVLEELRGGRVRQATKRFGGPLLPWSDSPRVNRLARTVEVALRDAVLASTDVEAVLELAARLEDDSELVEHALRLLPSHDGRRHIMRGHLVGIA